MYGELCCVWMRLFWLTAFFFLCFFLCCIWYFCLLAISAAKSYSHWDRTDLPLCEAFHQGESWASPGSSCSSTLGDQDVVEGLSSQETDLQHHVNGHGTSSLEKIWCFDLFWWLFWHFICLNTETLQFKCSKQKNLPFFIFSIHSKTWIWQNICTMLCEFPIFLCNFFTVRTHFVSVCKWNCGTVYYTCFF